MANMTNMTNMYDMTNMSNIQNMQIPLAYEHHFENMNTPFSILPILQICKKYATNINTSYFYIPKNIKYEKNAEYDNRPPGLGAAPGPGVGTKQICKIC